MSASEKEFPKNQQKTSVEQQESEESSRSPGVTDRELLQREKPENQPNPTETPKTED